MLRRETIFSAFVQAQNKQSISGGTGLGLSISSQLAELMGGSVGVRSLEGQGSTFFLQIPIEVHNERCISFDNIEEFQKLKMLIYSNQRDLSFKLHSFLRYADGVEYDVAIFVDDECESEFKREVLASQNKKFLVLMNSESSLYASFAHINYLCFPLYCSKIHTAFEELMQPQEEYKPTKVISSTFCGHILIAEDNEANQELIKILLGKYGLTYDLAHNGLEAFELFKRESYSLILMDEQMPIMSGNDAVQKIREYEAEHNLIHTPIAALTANVVKGVKEKVLLNGYDTFLGKPLVLKELEQLFCTFLQSSSALSAQIVPAKVEFVEGLDAQKLSKELMLSSDEFLMLLRLFLKKMQTTLQTLEDAISKREYKQIALLAHNIKGSSGNFRIESLQKSANEMEKMAKKHREDYEYERVFREIQERIESIKIL